MDTTNLSTIKQAAAQQEDTWRSAVIDRIKDVVKDINFLKNQISIMESRLSEVQQELRKGKIGEVTR